MKSLLLVAHGSRREASNDEVRHRTEQLKNYGQDQGEGVGFRSVDCAFLELASPSIPQGIEICVNKGATEIIVLPYFLSAGRHVSEDIPAEVNLMRKQYPEVEISIADYLGSAEGVSKILLSLALKSHS